METEQRHWCCRCVGMDRVLPYCHFFFFTQKSMHELEDARRCELARAHVVGSRMKRLPLGSIPPLFFTCVCTQRSFVARRAHRPGSSGSSSGADRHACKQSNMRKIHVRVARWRFATVTTEEISVGLSNTYVIHNRLCGGARLTKHGLDYCGRAWPG